MTDCPMSVSAKQQLAELFIQVVARWIKLRYYGLFEERVARRAVIQVVPGPAGQAKPVASSCFTAVVSPRCRRRHAGA